DGFQRIHAFFLLKLVKAIVQMMFFVYSYPYVGPLYWIWIGYYRQTIIKDFFVPGIYYRKFSLNISVELF
ncbi:hypothetical protein AMS59_20795, partial [Lysinibacillus sp. FJAT-14745]|uniref:hypothetical protein n=1 Tax=Lysinibacillus sp. FJAT-14745 TaxID=1704289 RepID=UPI0006AB9AEF